MLMFYPLDRLFRCVTQVSSANQAAFWCWLGSNQGFDGLSGEESLDLSDSLLCLSDDLFVGCFCVPLRGPVW